MPGSPGPAGAVGVNFRGNWSAEVLYKPGDVASLDGKNVILEWSSRDIDRERSRQIIQRRVATVPPLLLSSQERAEFGFLSAQRLFFRLRPFAHIRQLLVTHSRQLGRK